MKYDYCIVGAGPAGAVSAQQLAQQGKRCLIIEKRNHIAGNLHDHYNRYGILIHSYGPHFFRTDKDRIWNYLSQFTDWHYYQHKVLSMVEGMLVPFPINLDTYNMLHNTNLSAAEFERHLASFHSSKEAANAEEAAIDQMGEYLYSLFVKYYTRKQWGKDPQELHADTIRRIRMRTNRESRYQPRKYQAIPHEGYTKMIERMITHPNIYLLLNCDYKNIIDSIDYNHLIYSGPLDYYFDYDLGMLEYRSLRLEEKTFFYESYQEEAVINYPNNYAFTRITEYKKMTGQRHHFTTVHFEYPQQFQEGVNQPYYPILNDRNLTLREQYLKQANSLKKVSFLGRLAEYRYYDMDDAIEAAINLVKNLTN